MSLKIVELEGMFVKLKGKSSELCVDGGKLVKQLEEVEGLAGHVQVQESRNGGKAPVRGALNCRV